MIKDRLKPITTLRDVYLSFKEPSRLLHYIPNIDNFPEDKDLIVRLCSRNGDISGTSLGLLTMSGRQTTLDERVGLVYFVALVEEADTILDDPSTPKFQEPKQLSEFLMPKNIVLDSSEISITKLLELSLSKYSEEKKQTIQNFISQMLELHVVDKPYPYSYHQALEYKVATAVSYGRVALTLINSKFIESPAFDNIATSIQILDDAHDWQKDFEEGSMNLLLGTAYDQWQTNGNIPNQDWSFLINLAGKSQEYITPRKLFKHPELRHTKTAFGQHFMENASTSERFPFDKAFFALSRLKMGI